MQSIVLEKHKAQTKSLTKILRMGNDEHTSREAAYLTFKRKKQIFHLIKKDFPPA